MTLIQAFVAGIFIATTYEKIYAIKGLTGFKSKLRIFALILISIIFIILLAFFNVLSTNNPT